MPQPIGIHKRALPDQRNLHKKESPRNHTSQQRNAVKRLSSINECCVDDQKSKKPKRICISSLEVASRAIQLSVKPALPHRPTESTHRLGRVAKIVHQVQTKTCLTCQILQQVNWIVVWILMGISLKLATPLVAGMGLEPRTPRFQREERGIQHSRWRENGLQLQQGRENRVEREVAEQ